VHPFPSDPQVSIIAQPTPEDISQGLAEIERHLASQLPPAPPSPAAEETKRVQRLRAAVAEAHLLAQLQEDDTPLLVETPKVRKRCKATQQAAGLHALAQNPEMRAWQAADASPAGYGLHDFPGAGAGAGLAHRRRPALRR
ncbi:hypothetical protein, partial [Thermoactinospora rubra]|uniref:hypothetical protein n=1 Tax=Thermoactinospora rubra TaxID=1088767 RepID=UPI0019809E1C